VTEYAIQTQELQYRPGPGFEIRDLNLRVREGAIYGFLGPNGAGKTTTIQLLLGLRRAQGGSIRILGKEAPRDLPRILAATGYVPERPHLYTHFTVAQAIRYHGAFYTRFDWAYAEDLRRGFHLPLESRLSRLSKGELGKLLILLVLAQRPDLLVLDEPTDGLDPVVRRDVLSALLDFCAERAATVFISSHLIHELERICDWIGVMDRGRLTAELPMHAFKNGIKRIRVAHAPSLIGDTPFTLVSREATGLEEVWVVRGWQPLMVQWFLGAGAEVREVIDLDLEEGFVELLRAARSPQTA
jgi:ABC-2 type transport system ATP-binding protein